MGLLLSRSLNLPALLVKLRAAGPAIQLLPTVLSPTSKTDHDH
jgi:hypothetical protein